MVLLILCAKARLCLKYWSGEIPMPSKEEMLEEFRIESERRQLNGGSIRKSHLLDDDQVSFLWLLIYILSVDCSVCVDSVLQLIFRIEFII